MLNRGRVAGTGGVSRRIYRQKSISVIPGHPSTVCAVATLTNGSELAKRPVARVTARIEAKIVVLFIVLVIAFYSNCISKD